MQDITQYVRQQAHAAKQAYYALASASTAQKNAALLRMAALIEQHRADILAANQQGIQGAMMQMLAHGRKQRCRRLSCA